jgi:hypothetical protein
MACSKLRSGDTIARRSLCSSSQGSPQTTSAAAWYNFSMLGNEKLTEDEWKEMQERWQLTTVVINP